MPPRMQGDLLRALQSGEVRRLGGRETIHVDVRVIAASNRDLEKEVERGRFRADLYYRLAVLKLVLPPLRDRVDDIPLLVGVLTARQASRFTDRALARLVAHSWPGNVRELQNVLRRIAVAGRSTSWTSTTCRPSCAARRRPDPPRARSSRRRSRRSAVR